MKESLVLAIVFKQKKLEKIFPCCRADRGQENVKRKPILFFDQMTSNEMHFFSFLHFEVANKTKNGETEPVFF